MTVIVAKAPTLSRGGVVSARIHVGEERFEVWLEAPVSLSTASDPLLPCTLLPAMVTGAPLHIDGATSSRLAGRIPELQQQLLAVGDVGELGSLGVTEVRVSVERVTPRRPAPGARTAAFFSGGVDSFWTVLDQLHAIDVLILVIGLDISLADRELAATAEARLCDAAAGLGKPLLRVDTNLRAFSDRFVPWDGFYGSGLASVALCLAPSFRRILVAGERGLDQLRMRGSNPYLDPLWSTEAIEIEHRLHAPTRARRLESIAPNRVVQETLRVCWENPGSAYNCGRCEKCLRTMVALEAIGVRESFRTFPRSLDLEAVANITPSPSQADFWRDNLDLVIRRHASGELRAAVEACLSRTARQAQHRRPFAPLPVSRRPAALEDPLVGIVVPTYRQPEFLSEALASAVGQDMASSVRIVVVNDGCPSPATDAVGTAFRDGLPAQVEYLRQRNRGVSAARNAGIRRAFERWPQLQAVLLLDSDNVLSPWTVRAMWTALVAAPEAAWVYPELEIFGETEERWLVPGHFSVYRQLFENQCDAGCLIRREIFDTGLFFDETMRSGYEDWEFFLRAGLAGFRGIPAGSCGFHYRRRRHSMLTETLASHDEVRASIHARHLVQLQATQLTSLEHDDLPRFLVLDPETGQARLLTCFDRPASGRLTRAELARELAASHGGETQAGRYLPPVTIVATDGFLEFAADLRILPGLALRCQEALAGAAVFGIHVGEAANPGGLEIGVLGPGERPVAALALRTHRLAELVLEGAGAVSIAADGFFDIRVDPTWTDSLPAAISSLASTLAKLAEEVPRDAPVAPPPTIATHTSFSAARHIDRLETTMPWAGSRIGSPAAGTLAVFVSGSAADGGERRALEHALPWRHVDPEPSTHLVLTEAGRFEGQPDLLRRFETITSLAGLTPARADALRSSIAASVDRVLSTDSLRDPGDPS